jgi:hypothetical protein
VPTIAELAASDAEGAQYHARREIIAVVALATPGGRRNAGLAATGKVLTFRARSTQESAAG